MNDWTSNDLRALMEPVEVAIGMSIPSEGVGLHPSVPAASLLTTKEVDVGRVEEPTSRAQDIHLEGEGESSPFSCPPYILHLSLG